MPFDSATEAVGQPRRIAPDLLRSWPLPQPDESSDKDSRGRVLVIGGAPEMPGAIILAATAALRSGAGKLQIATCGSIAPYVAVAVPEARVFALAETSDGAIAPAAAEQLVRLANQVEATLIGPGMVGETTTSALLEQFVPRLEHGVLILDAIALSCGRCDRRLLADHNGRAVLTPHAGEMATMLGIDKAEVTANPATIAWRAAAELGVVITLKGADTFIAAPDGALYHYSSGNIGLATSGSGDTLAGVVAGLAARGAVPLQAAGWGVYLHGEAGNQLAKRMGRLGYLARELLDEIPPLMNSFAS